MLRRIITCLIIFCLSAGIFASDFSDPILDQSMEAFAEKNYTEALALVEAVLVAEPDNETALLYKETIENVIAQDENPADLGSEETSNSEEVVVSSQNSAQVDNSTIEPDVYNDFFVTALHFTKTANDYDIFEIRNKIILGAPIIDVRFKSSDLDVDITTLSYDDYPFDELIDFNSYSADISAGIRLKTFDKLPIDTGYFDFRVGMSYEQELYIGYDTECLVFRPLMDNLLSRSFWIGSDGEISTDSSSFEIKTGLRTGIFSLGWFYNFSEIDRYGLITSFYF